MTIGRHLILWLVLLLVETIGVAVLSSPAAMLERIDAEVGMARSAFGDAAANRLVRQSNDRFERWFNKPLDFTARRMVADTGGRGGRQLELPAVSMMGTKTNEILLAFWVLVWQVLFRLAQYGAWLWPVALLLAAAGVDGYAQWRRKFYTFGFTNPVLYNTAMHGLIAMCFATLALLPAPWPLSPLFLPFWTLLAVAPLLVACANFQRMVD